MTTTRCDDVANRRVSRGGDVAFLNERMAIPNGTDKVIAEAVQAHLEKTGKIPDNELDETDALDGLADPTEGQEEGQEEGQDEAANWMSV